ncbi:hypothetical protein MAR_014998 [Mya arenaria]|uniref:RAI1-like domain-containing protein n=1 Tax=Mya arenaria TaxID=6604 RepID=A0ABY7FIM3_MYAAR|nr:hypothetical protein MAR_014998 [Mya arenaria]
MDEFVYNWREKSDNRLLSPLLSFVRGFKHHVEIGCFLLDINREFQDDTCQRKSFIKPSNYNNVRFDLTKGYEGMVKRDEYRNEQLDHLLNGYSIMSRGWVDVFSH